MTWQDGEPFGAADICYSWKKILDPAVPTDAQRPGTEEISNCEVLDPVTYRLTHKAALPTNKWNAMFNLIPKHAFEKDEKANPDLKSGDYYIKLNRELIGNGPYKLVEWIENDRLVLERWDGYWGPKPHFKKIVFRIIPDQNNTLLTFTKGDIDEFRMSPKQVATQTLVGSDFDKAGGKKVRAVEWTMDYIGYNMSGSNPFFADIRVRKAMTHACDIKRIIQDVSWNLYPQARGFFHPDSWMFDPATPLYEFDLVEAARLLDEAGWVIDPAREGWRHKVIDGKPVKFEFTMIIRQGQPTGPPTAAIFQEDLQSIGVKLNTQIVELATHQERMRKHDYESAYAAWGTGTDPDTSWNLWVSDQYDPEGKAGRNFGGYSNKRVDELYLLGRHEFDFAKRKAYYQEIGRLIYEDQPYTFIWNRATLWAIQGRIHGVSYGPRGVFNFAPAELAWWVRRGEAKHVAAVP
jgi:peptide/nickel transport system substrate-binding protein